MSKRIHISTTLPGIPAGAYAVMQEGDEPVDAVCRSLARRAGARSWRAALNCHAGDTATYDVMLVGRELPSGGGYSVVAECRVYV